jgi:hypothetical protein
MFEFAIQLISSTIQEMRDYIDQNLAIKEFVGKELSEMKFDILKWMFLFWLGQMSITIGIVLILIKK